MSARKMSSYLSLVEQAFQLWLKVRKISEKDQTIDPGQAKALPCSRTRECKVKIRVI